jgi:transposase
MAKEMDKAKAELEKLSQQAFACEDEARRTADEWIAKYGYLKYSNLESVIKGPTDKGKRGGPKSGEGAPKSGENGSVGYFIKADLEFNQEMIEKEGQLLGRFILATNDAELKPHDILTFFKEQAQLETGFRFLEGRDLNVSEVILNNTNRIQGIACLMGITFLVNSILETKLRSGLAKNNDTLINFVKKPIKRPTLRLASKEFERLFGIIRYNKDLKDFSISFPGSLMGQRNIILKALGDEYLSFYNSSVIEFSLDWKEWIIRYINENA